MFINKNKIKMILQKNITMAKLYFNKYSNLLYDETTIPFISIYHYNPKPYNDEDVIIPFYFTDFYQREYYYNDTSLKFTLRYELDGDVKYKYNLTSGDHEVNFGKLSEGVHWYSLQVIDEQGRESRRVFNDLWVVDRLSYPITEEQIYTITDDDLSNYSINKNNSEIEENMINNRVGLSQLFSDLQSQGYRKCILPEGTYRVNRCLRKGTIENKDCPIIIPANFTVDMNNSTFKLHPYDDREYGDRSNVENLIVRLGSDANDNIDSHLLNGIVEGDYFERKEMTWNDGSNAISGNNGEASNAILFYGNKYSSIENVTIKQITGYNVYSIFNGNGGNGIFNQWFDDLMIENTGDEIIKEGYVTSNMGTMDQNMLDNKYIIASIWLATGGLRGKYWDMVFHFYDMQQKFIESIKSYQFTRCRIPDNAKYFRVTFRGTSSEMKNLSIHNINAVRYCEVKNCHFIDNRTCAAINQVQHFSFINCDFTRSGQSITPSEIDFEDGWEACQDVFILNCKELEPAGSGDIITQTGLNHVYENNENLRFSIGYRVHGLCLRHNKGDSYGQSIGIMTKNTLRVYNNEFTAISGNVLSDYDAEKDGVKAKIKNNILNLQHTDRFNNFFIIDDCDIKLGRNSNIHIINSRITPYDSASYIGENVLIENSTFNIDDEYTEYKFSFNKSNVVREYINCQYLCPCNLATHNYLDSGIWNSCIFHNTILINPRKVGNVIMSNNMGDIQFNNCIFKDIVTINIHECPECYVQFNNCTFEASPIFLGYGEDNTEFNNCILPN